MYIVFPQLQANNFIRGAMTPLLAKNQAQIYILKQVIVYEFRRGLK